MEKRGTVNGVTIYDDFAHHPTAIKTTLKGLRAHVGKERIIAVFEPRSNTMKMGVWKNALADSLGEADQIFCLTQNAQWAITALDRLAHKTTYSDNLDQLIQDITMVTKPGDHLLIMSNGSFGGIHGKILSSLQNR